MDFGTGFPIIVCAVFGIMFLMSVWARRDHLIRLVSVVLIAGSLAFAVFVYAATATDSPQNAPYWGILTFVCLYLLLPIRKRRMRAVTRRRIVAKWELKTGRKFNARFHEIDHVVPFSRGGNETEDNLRVIERSANRSKGAKSAWWDILGRW